MLELEGETVRRCKPVIGYLHTGMEKTGEELSYLQGPTNVTRMDYSSPLFNELVFSMATEELLGIEVPERAVWIRMLMCELNRMSSHLLFQATNGMDIGAVGMMIYGWREREEMLRLFETITGLRMNHNYIRPGGVAVDLPDGWRDDVMRRASTRFPHASTSSTTCSPASRSGASASRGSASSTPPSVWRSGSPARCCGRPGYAWDLRRDMPYLAYDQVDFDVLVGSYGDCFDRYAIRLNEIRESIRIVRQIVDKMPPGDYRVQDKKVTPPPGRASTSRWKR